VIGTLAVDGWAVTFGAARSLEGSGRAVVSPRLILAVPNVTDHPSTAIVSCYTLMG